MSDSVVVGPGSRAPRSARAPAERPWRQAHGRAAPCPRSRRNRRTPPPLRGRSAMTAVSALRPGTANSVVLGGRSAVGSEDDRLGRWPRRPASSRSRSAACAPLGGEASLRGRRGSPEPGDAGHILGAAASAALLAAAGDERRASDRLVAPDQRADALGPADLVRRHRHKIGAQRLDIAGNPARRLDRIDMQQAARRMHQVGRLGTGWITPVSLLASIRETSGRPPAASCAARAPPDRPRPLASTRTVSTCRPNRPPRQHRRMLDRRHHQPLAAPAALTPGDSASALASVPPAVNTTLRGLGPDQGRNLCTRRSISWRAARPSAWTDDGFPTGPAPRPWRRAPRGRSGAVAFQSR